MSELSELRRAALSIFSSALESVDAIGALRRSVKLQDARLKILDSTFDLHSTPHIYAIAIGKAARAMAYALEEVLGERIISAVVSAPAETTARPLSSRWQIFTGGHPLPNQESLNAARRAFELLDEANREDALIIFLVSGGGSAMIEWPRDLSVTLDDLCQTNRVLVSCGADISEVNSIRRALSSVKGGGLARRASRAAQVTLIVSDVNTGREFDVASGPSIQQPSETFNPAIVVEKYKLQSRLPSTILDALKNFSHDENSSQQTVAPRKHYVLLNNADALDAAAKTARAQGFVVEKAEEIIEQPVAEGAAALVSRLNDLYLREGGNGRGVCLISGGEFACPVRGSGLGGHVLHVTLRLARFDPCCDHTPGRGLCPWASADPPRSLRPYCSLRHAASPQQHRAIDERNRKPLHT